MIKKDLISIIILNYKTPELSLRCAMTILDKVSSKVAYKYEVIIIDNGSGPESRESFENSAIKQLENVQFIYNDINAGYGAGNNLGAKNAKGDFLLFLNADTEMVDDALSALMDEYARLSKDNKVGFIQPRLYLTDALDDVQITCSRMPTVFNLFQENISILRNIQPENYANFRYYEWDRQSTRRADIVCGAAIFCRKDFFIEIGRFDESFFLYFEEYDICSRGLARGYFNYYSTATSLIHRLNQSPNPSMSKKLIYITSFLKFLVKHKASSKA